MPRTFFWGFIILLQWIQSVYAKPRRQDVHQLCIQWYIIELDRRTILLVLLKDVTPLVIIIRFILAGYKTKTIFKNSDDRRHLLRKLLHRELKFVIVRLPSLDTMFRTNIKWLIRISCSGRNVLWLIISSCWIKQHILFAWANLTKGIQESGLVLWHINECRLVNAIFIFIHLHSSISNHSVLYKYSFYLHSFKYQNSSISHNSV